MKVSILIPCFNNAQFIADSVEAALRQVYENKEVIVYDDGSTDDSLEVIRSFGKRIEWEAGPNKGGNFARNKLLSMATGEWIQFLDADDLLKKDKISQQVALVSNDCDVIYGSVTTEHWQNGQKVSDEISIPDVTKDIYSQWLEWTVAQTGSVLWRAEAIHRIGGWNEDYPCCQDNEICLRALQNKLRFVQSRDSGTVYRLWSSDTVSKRNPIQLLNTKTYLIETMIEWLEGEGMLEDHHTIVASKTCFQMARLYAARELAAATDYHRKLKSKKLMKLDSKVCPASYKMLYYIFGFKFAEWVASQLRS